VGDCIPLHGADKKFKRRIAAGGEVERGKGRCVRDNAAGEARELSEPGMGRRDGRLCGEGAGRSIFRLA
jgi:hypothetical protein